MRTTFNQERDIAAVLFEPVRNSPYVAPAWYIAEVRQLCNRHGAVLIFDEIPAGLGKTGCFFNSEHSSVSPVITLLGKALGGGALPVAAVLADAKLDTASDLNLGYFTHERNPVLATAALTTLEIIDEEGLVARAREFGRDALAALGEMARHSQIVREVRGAGLMLAVEFGFEEGEHAGEVTAESVYRECLDAGLIALSPRASTMTLSAPLIISRNDLTRALQILEASIRRGEAAPGTRLRPQLPC
jgi:4-aminobutyrate aminotransferase